ncbi:MAG TPA: glycosyltransferase family 39 protein [Streptosporangiaceae bacterium]|nr:glycosyltransferase family 39 protein [Streptosporangiaceae bacterium]
MSEIEVREPGAGTPGASATNLPATALAPLSRWVIGIGGLLFAVLMALSGRYGFHHDELYFLDGGRHLQASYVDQPVVTPLLAWVTLKTFGVSLVGLRLWPALAAWGTVIVAGLTAREFGGGRRAQLLAAFSVATMPAVYGADHMLDTAAIDILAWSALAFMVIRIGRTGDQRWWVPAGAILGLGVENKHLIGFFAIAIVIGAFATGARTTVLNRWFLAGAAIAVALEIPDLWWQATHGWATIAMTQSLNASNGGAANILVWIVGQLIVLGLFRAWGAVAGIRFLWKSGRPLWKALVWAYTLLFVVFMLTTGAQIYYVAGAYVFLLAAGAVALDGWLVAKRSRIYRFAGGLTVSALVFAPFLLPILPVADANVTNAVFPVQNQTIGWPQLVSTVHGVWFSLPAQQRAHAVIFTDDFGEAGAINELGHGTGLPTAVSGHDTEWWWGPGNSQATTVIAVTLGPDSSSRSSNLSDLHRYFRTVRQAATLSNPWGIKNENYHGQVWICTGLRHPWSQLWPELRHYD